MKLWSRLVLGATLLASAGCGPRESTPLQRKQAANLMSEAQFAVALRDFGRAEGLISQATKLCPDVPGYWIDLGSARLRLGERARAKDAYEQALRGFENLAGKNRTDSEPALQQVFVLALLGRIDDARAMQDKVLKRFPNDRNVRVWVEGKRLDRLIADPGFRQVAL